MLKKAISGFIVIIFLIIVMIAAFFLREAIAPYAVRHYQKEYNLDLTTAKYRLSIMPEMGELVGSLEAMNDKKYAGAYINNEEPFGLYILYKASYGDEQQYLIDEAKFNQLVGRLLAQKSWKSLVHIKKVKYSLSDLDKKIYIATQLISSLGFLVGSSTDVEKNLVEIHVADLKALNQILIAKNIKLPEGIYITEVVDFLKNDHSMPH